MDLCAPYPSLLSRCGHAAPRHPDAPTTDVLSRIDTTSPACSVKDSFAGLDLAPAGFDILFDAEWIYRPTGMPVPPSRGLWAAQVRTAAGLRDWQRAWHGAGDSPDVFRPSLLEVTGIRVVAVHDGAGLVGGGALNVDAGMVGVTNMFLVRNADPVDVWSCLLTMAIDHFPGLPIVGYERLVDLAPARRIGFSVVGPLRLWMATTSCVP